jgi:spermidine synthase
VKPTETLATAVAPDGSQLVLQRHDGAYVIRVAGVELMSTRRVNSEQELAVLACTPVQQREPLTVLIGGLGFGFTLRAALAILPAHAQVMVAELVPAVVEWNRNPDWPLASDVLADARVSLLERDVMHVLRERPQAFDAIMLDVDNGAEYFTTGGNRALYIEAGIRSTIAALRPGGVVTWWSSDAEPAFVKRLEHAGLSVRIHRVRSHTTSGARNAIIVATR